jgi:hypothetical protein
MLPHLLRRLLLPKSVLRNGPRRLLHQPRRGALLRNDVLHGWAAMLRESGALLRPERHLLRAELLQPGQYVLSK